MTGLRSLPVLANRDVRGFFLVTAIITGGLRLWINSMGPDPRGLTGIYYRLFTELDDWGAVSLLLILCVAALVPDRFPMRSALLWISDHTTRIAVATTLVLCAGTLLVYQNKPLAMDEYAQLFQSQWFAAGH